MKKKKKIYFLKSNTKVKQNFFLEEKSKKISKQISFKKIENHIPHKKIFTLINFS